MKILPQFTKSKYFYVIVLIIIIADFFIISNLRKRNAVEQIAQIFKPHFKYGDRCPEFTINDVNGNILKSGDHKGKVLGIGIFHGANSYEGRLLTYVDLLYKKYNANGFDFIGIQTANAAKARYFIDKYKISFPIVSDQNGKIASAWGFHAQTVGFILKDRSDTLRFIKNSLLNEDIIRQLVERYTLGTAKALFSDNSANYFQKDDIIKDISLFDIKSKNKIKISDLLEKPLIVTFFNKYCPSCRGLYSRLGTLNKLSSTFRDKIKFLCLFSETSGIGSLFTFSKVYNVNTFDIYIHETDILRDQDYISQLSLQRSALTIVVIPGRKIIFVEHRNQDETALYQDLTRCLESISY